MSYDQALAVIGKAQDSIDLIYAEAPDGKALYALKALQEALQSKTPESQHRR